MVPYSVLFLMRIYVVTAGLGDSNGRSVPTVVKDIGLVGQVACGSLHTLVLSADGWTVWSFGDGDGGQCIVDVLFHYF